MRAAVLSYCCLSSTYNSAGTWLIRWTMSVRACCCCCVASVVVDSSQPHRWQPTRLPRPWDSPGKNTGVGCYFLLQCMKVKSESEIIQSWSTLRNPMDCSPPGWYLESRIWIQDALISIRVLIINIYIYKHIPISISIPILSLHWKSWVQCWWFASVCTAF